MNNLIKGLLEHKNSIYCHLLMDNEETGFALAWHTIDKDVVDRRWPDAPPAICVPFLRVDHQPRIDYRHGWRAAAFNHVNPDGIVVCATMPRWTKLSDDFVGKGLYEPALKEDVSRAAYQPPLFLGHKNFPEYLPADLQLKFPPDALLDLTALPCVLTCAHKLVC